MRPTVAEATGRGGQADRWSIGKGIAMLLLGVALFGCGEAVVKYLTQSYDVAQVVWGRFTFHALVFLIIFARRGIIGQMRTARPGLQIARSVLLLIATGLFFTALQFLPLAEAVAAGAVPVLPDRLSYPEVVPAAWHGSALYPDGGLTTRLRDVLTDLPAWRTRCEGLPGAMRRFDWREVVDTYDERLGALAEGYGRAL